MAAMRWPAWLTHLNCRLHGRHDPVVERQGNRMYLRCHECGLRTGGWTIEDRRLRGETDRRSMEARRHGDRRDVERRHPEDRRGHDRRGEGAV